MKLYRIKNPLNGKYVRKTSYLSFSSHGRLFSKGGLTQHLQSTRQSYEGFILEEVLLVPGEQTDLDAYKREKNL